VDAVKELWQTPEIKKAWDMIKYTSQYPHSDYYMNELDRLLANDYVPTNDDIVRSRQATIGASTTYFWREKYWWAIIDVGGHMPERAKWMGIVKEGVNAMIYFVALDDFLTDSGEEVGKTKMDVTKLVWEEIINSDIFTNKDCTLLFLNKIDLFKQIIEDGEQFKLFKEKTEYDGPQTVDDSLEFMKNSFLELSHRRESKDIYVHETCAILVDHIQVVWAFMRESIFKLRMKDF